MPTSTAYFVHVVYNMYLPENRMWGTEHTAQLPTVVGRYLLTYQPTGTKKLHYLHILDKYMEDMHLECKSSIFDSYSILIVRDNVKT